MFTYSATFKSFGAEMFNFVAHCSLPLEISLKKIRALELRCLIWWRIVISFNTIHALQFTSRVAPKWLVSLCHWAMSFVVYILALSFLTVTARRGKVNIYLLDIILCSLFMSILYVIYLNPVLSFFFILQLVKTCAFRKLTLNVFFSFFLFQSKSPCCLLVTSPSLVLWNITSNIITTHIMTRSEMWLLSSKRRTYRSQIWSLRLSAKTCIATSTAEGSLFRWIQVLTLSQR